MHSRPRVCAVRGPVRPSNEIVAAASWDDVGRRPDGRSGSANLRWMLIRLVEETG